MNDYQKVPPGPVLTEASGGFRGKRQRITFSTTLFASGRDQDQTRQNVPEII